MGYVLRPIKGLLYGIIGGGLLGCVFAWGSVARSFTSLRTFWPDCGPHIFVPLWLCSVAGLISKLGDESFFWLIILMLSGVCAGLMVPAAYQHAFGQPFRMGTGFMGIPYAQEIVLSGGGVAASFFWYFGVNKILRN
jgi:hypothetical protein